MHLADHAQRLSRGADGRATPGMACRMGCRREIEPAPRGKGLKIALGVEEVDPGTLLAPLLRPAKAEREPGDALGLDREVGPGALEAAADLEDAHALLATIQVRAKALHQAPDEARAHDAHVARDGVREADG